MDEMVVRAVERAIETMRRDLADKITMDDLARSAIFSKFHFSRIFQQVTGVSPGRFLSAMRLEEAKRLLRSTLLTVADISYQVGYNSVGTFSSRFRSSVGVSPITYRQLGSATAELSTANWNLAQKPVGTLRGHVSAPPTDWPGMVFVGLFPHRMLQGSPVRWAVLERPGPYTLPDVPQDTWHLMAHSVAAGTEEETGHLPLVGSRGPITMLPDSTAQHADVHLRPIRTVDPPVLLALPDVRSAAFHRTAEQLRPAV